MSDGAQGFNRLRPAANAEAVREGFDIVRSAGLRHLCNADVSALQVGDVGFCAIAGIDPYLIMLTARER